MGFYAMMDGPVSILDFGGGMSGKIKIVLEGK